MVSVLDLLPTVMDALGVKKPARLDGRSFYPVLKGEKQADREYIIKQYHENSGRSRDPMCNRDKDPLVSFQSMVKRETHFCDGHQWNGHL